ncbi:MAG: DMT family transporter [Candidatus Heimdallarchaeota archaeon]
MKRSFAKRGISDTRCTIILLNYTLLLVNALDIKMVIYGQFKWTEGKKMFEIGSRTALQLRRIGPLFIMTAAFLWTLDAFFRTFLVGTIGFISIQIVGIEHIIIVLVLIPWLFRYLAQLREFNKKEWAALLFIGIGGSALATIALTEAFSLAFNPAHPLSVTMVVLLQQTQPFIAIGLASLVLNERLPKEYFILAFIAIFGVFLIFFPTLTNYTEDLTQLFVIADIDFLAANTLGILALVAAFFWGGSTVFGRYLLEHTQKRLEYQAMTTYRFFIAFIFLIALNIVLILTGTTFPSTNLILQNLFGIAWAFLFIALIVGLLSLVLYYYGLKNTHATVSTICELFYPLSAFVLLPILLNETLFISQIVGGLVLVLASGILSYRYSKFMRTGESKTDQITNLESLVTS